MHHHQTNTALTYRYKDQGKPSQKKEYFMYDAIDRLIQVQLDDEISQQISYDQSGLGNITRKTGVTTTEDMVYGSEDSPPVGPYALTEIPAVDPEFDATEQTVGYTNFDKISLVRMGLLDIAVDYGHDLQRIKQTVSYNHQAEETKVFAGGLYEEISSANGNVRKLHYIPSPDGVFAIYVDDLMEGKKMHYILKDHLGSYNVIADEHGNKLEELSFDAWGTRRNATSWKPENVPTSFLFDRGFTGHEHLDEFGLINMNGRVYDDAVGRFLSPDPFVQMPDNAQNFNRYSYCLNNPLIYTDPSGEIIGFIIAGAILGAYIGGSLEGGSFNPAEWQKGWVKGAIIGGLIGAASGYGIGALWQAGATVSVGLNGMGQTLPLVSFSKAGFTTANSVAGYFGFGGLATTAGFKIKFSTPSANTEWKQKFDNEMYLAQLDNVTFGPYNLHEIEINGKVPQQTYYENALSYKDVPYYYSGWTMDDPGIDCSGLVCLATNSEVRWTTASGNPPGEWQLINYVHSSSGFNSSAKEGDLLVWPNHHAAFFAGGSKIFHAHGDHGTPTGYTFDLFRYWIKTHGFPDLFRQK